ncbi:PPE family protein [Mycobacterium sp. 23]|uniref:PPE family protein n=1 Tax=Mycobacterium sp. 23 TaxID=3400424 RepID=UPI003AAFBA89
MDFAVLPPEINSGRMYAGAGSGPLVAAAGAWEALAAELDSSASAYRSVIAELTGGPWVGPSSTSMTAAAIPYASWVSSTAAQAGRTAAQLKSAVAAYEAAFAATVPPAEIEVNRALLAALVATNLLGQNTAAIAATEAQYAQMWAQDAAAMFGYAGASAVATTLMPFAAPPQNTDPSGTAAQAAAVGQAAATPSGSAQSTLAQMAAVPNLLQGLAAPGSVDPLTLLHEFATSPLGMAINKFGSDAGNVATEFSGVAFVASGITPLFVSLYPLALPPSAAAAAADVSGDAAGSALVGSSVQQGPVSAGVGEAATVGKMSVPQGWVESPNIRLAATALPAAGAPQAEAAGAGFGIPPVGSVVNAPRGTGEPGSRAAARSRMLPPWATETDRPAPVSPAQQRPQHVASALSERERDEIAQLRRELGELATERDAAARLIKEAML